MANTAQSHSVVALSILRGQAEGESRYDHYDVPAAQAASLLDALRWIREHRDDSLAFRYSCISANACKECMVQLDGKVVYACVARPVPGKGHVVEPLSNKTRLRDLVTAIAPARERLLHEERD